MKAVFFDVDGTLIEGRDPKFRHMSEEVKAAIKKLQAQGAYVFIASGRSLPFLDSEMRSFGFDGYVLLNGAVVFFRDKIIYRAPLEKSFVHSIVDKCKANNLQYTLEGARDAYVLPEFEYLINRLEDYGIHKEQLCLSYDLDELTVYKIEIDSPDQADKHIITESLPDDMTYVDDLAHGTCHVEVYAKANSKASGILKVLEKLGIDVKDSYAFGDGDNDIEMLSTVGLGMAMGNATDKAKAAAKVIVPSIFDNGIAYGIEKYILKK